MDPLSIAKQPENVALEPSDILLTDRIALVTGGGGGIGQGIALGFAKFGAHVAVLDIEPHRVERTVEVLAGFGRRAFGCVVDVMDAEALRAAVVSVADHFGRLDILVNNAGGVSAKMFETMSANSMRRHVDINLTSMFTATQAAVPYLRQSGEGASIINVTSIEGFRAAPRFAVYAACKAGMVSFTKSMAVELGIHGIRVNALAPDHTITPGNRGNRHGPVDPSAWLEESLESQEAMRRLVPLGREGVVEECAGAAIFLASKMAAYITGITLHVDGGTYASSGWLRAGEEAWTLSPGWMTSS